MSAATAPVAPALVRVTVSSHERRADLALPAAWPLAELVPGILDSLGLLGADPPGHAVLTVEGRPLDPELSLAGLGVRDGTALVVTTAADATAAAGAADHLRHDDPAEAVTDVLAARLRRWPPGQGRRVGLVGASVLLALGAVALATAGGPESARAAVGLAIALAAGAATLSGIGGGSAVPVVLTWASAAHAAVAGGLLAPGSPPAAALEVAAAGAGALLVTAPAMLVLTSGRAALLPAAALGGLAAAGGGCTAASGAAPSTAAAVLLVAAVVAGAGVPRLAWAAARALRDAGGPGGGPPEAGALGGDALLAHRVVVALQATLGLSLLVLAPVAATAGVAGAGLGLLGCAAVLLRARHFGAAAPVWACLVPGGAAVVATLGTLVWQLPAARLPLAPALVVVALVLCSLPPRAGPRWHRAADLVEAGCLGAAVPLLVTTAGVPGRVLEVVGSLAGRGAG